MYFFIKIDLFRFIVMFIELFNFFFYFVNEFIYCDFCYFFFYNYICGDFVELLR